VILDPQIDGSVMLIHQKANDRLWHICDAQRMAPMSEADKQVNHLKDGNSDQEVFKKISASF
jgi:hypothetical protein